MKKAGNRDYSRIRKALANEMFKQFPRAPLTSLVWILENEKMPNETDFNVILKNFPFSKTKQFLFHTEKRKLIREKKGQKLI